MPDGDLVDVYGRLSALLRDRADSLTGTLEGDGVGVFDGALGAARCASLREEIDVLHATGHSAFANLGIVIACSPLRNLALS